MGPSGRTSEVSAQARRVAAAYVGRKGIQKFADPYEMGKTKENEHIRWFASRTSIRVWDLANAGKRGKMVDSFALYDIDYIRDPSLTKQVEQFPKWFPRMTYQRALEQARSLFEMGAGKLQTTQEKGVRVAPPGFGPIKVETDEVSLEADWDTFRIRDKKDTNNDPTCIPAIRGGVKSVKLFFRWVKDNEQRIKGWTYYQILTAMRSEGIEYHDYCAMD